MKLVLNQPRHMLGFLGGSVVKNLPAKAGDPGFHPWVEKIPLEEEMGTHSSILAWRIPGTDEPGCSGLQSMGPQRVGCDLAAEHEHAHMPGRSNRRHGLGFGSPAFQLVVGSRKSMHVGVNLTLIPPTPPRSLQ